jgi:hypothetical protein
MAQSRHAMSEQRWAIQASDRLVRVLDRAEHAVSTLRHAEHPVRTVSFGEIWMNDATHRDMRFFHGLRASLRSAVHSVSLSAAGGVRSIMRSSASA